MPKTVVSLSGGLDSAVALAYAKSLGHELLAYGFCYGSKHNKYENEAAANVAEHYHVPFRLIDLSGVFKGFKSDLLLSGGAIPEGHYEAESMKATVVPCRNLIFASILAGLAESEGADSILLGVHAGDHHIYPDCRPDFVGLLDAAIGRATSEKVQIEAPLLHINKSVIVKMGHELGVPFHLTRTCYTDGPIACGRCGSCQERLEAFALNRLRDPLEYETREPLPKDPNVLTSAFLRTAGNTDEARAAVRPEGGGRG